MWRRGPSGIGTLCNSCGLQYAKLEKGIRLSAAHEPTMALAVGALPDVGVERPFSQDDSARHLELPVEMQQVGDTVCFSQVTFCPLTD